MPSEVNQTKKFKYYTIFVYMQPLKKYIEMENRWMVGKQQRVVMREMCEGGQRVQTSTYMVNKFWRSTL